MCFGDTFSETAGEHELRQKRLCNASIAKTETCLLKAWDETQNTKELEVEGRYSSKDSRIDGVGKAGEKCTEQPGTKKGQHCEEGKEFRGH